MRTTWPPCHSTSSSTNNPCLRDAIAESRPLARRNDENRSQDSKRGQAVHHTKDVADQRPLQTNRGFVGAHNPEPKHPLPWRCAWECLEQNEVEEHDDQEEKAQRIASESGSSLALPCYNVTRIQMAAIARNTTHDRCRPRVNTSARAALARNVKNGFLQDMLRYVF